MNAALKGAAPAALVVLLALGVAACGSSGDGTSSGKGKTTAGYFSAESPWNTQIEALPKSPHSAKMLSLARRREGVVELPENKGYRSVERIAKGGFSVNAQRWAPLVVEAGGSDAVTTRMVCRQAQCGPPDELVPAVLELPAGTTPNPSYDGWLS
ncbi:MAG TPA: hypothetical protein VIJ21_04260, partial [Solirubrobacterales bacterium]